MKKLVLGLVACAVSWAGEAPRPAPPLAIPTPGGRKISVESLRGKVVLLKFFLTDCRHCQAVTTSAIVPLYKEWQRRGLEVVGVALNADAAKLIPEFVERFDARYPIGIGDGQLLLRFADLPAVGRVSAPHLFLIDRRGVIRSEHPASEKAFYDNAATNLRAELDTLLKEPAPGRKPARKPAPKS